MKISEKTYTMDGGKNVNAYYVKVVCGSIMMPLGNCQEMLNSIYGADRTHAPTNDEITNLKYKKFEVFIRPDDVKQMSKHIYNFKKKSNKLDTNIKIEYGKFKDVSGNDLYKSKFILDCGCLVPLIYGKNTNAINFNICGIRFFEIDGNYFTNLVVSSITHLENDMNNYAISPYSLTVTHTRPVINTEINKIKKEYKSYVASIKKKIKPSSFEINV